MKTVFPVITTEQVIIQLTARLSRMRVPAADRPVLIAVVGGDGAALDHRDSGAWAVGPDQLTLVQLIEPGLPMQSRSQRATVHHRRARP